MRRFGTRLVLVLLLVAGTDLSAAALYGWMMGEPFYQRVADPNRAINRKYRLRHPVYHHDLIPNSELPARWGLIRYEIRTNALGFKAGGTGEVPLRSEHYRMLLMGDSFTEGIGVSHRDTFAGHIERALFPKSVDVFNAGVSSYSPSIYLAKTRYLIEEVGLDFDELVVFLDISDAEDEASFYRMDDAGRVVSALAEEGDREDGEGQSGRGWFRRHSILYAIPRVIEIRRDASRVSDELEEHFFIRYPRAMWTVDEEPFEAWGRIGLERMEERMTRLWELLQRHDIRMTLVVYPWPTQIYYKDRDSVQSRTWRAWSQVRGVQFIDLFPAFVSEDDQTNKETILDYFIPDDMHWNEAGHARVAELFLSQHVRGDGTGSPGARGASSAGTAHRSRETVLDSPSE